MLAPLRIEGLPGRTGAWRVDLGQSGDSLRRLATVELLAEGQEPDSGPAGNGDHRQRQLASRIALRVALARWLGTAPASVEFVRGPLGELALGGAHASRGVDFSLSRSGECCLIAISEAGPIGIDVERVRPFPRLERLIARRFASCEADAIMRLSGERRLRAFYICWTRKEAYLKARGLGLRMPLSEVVTGSGEEGEALISLPDDDPGSWSVGTVHPGRDLIGSIARRQVSQS